MDKLQTVIIGALVICGVSGCTTTTVERNNPDGTGLKFSYTSVLSRKSIGSADYKNNGVDGVSFKLQDTATETQAGDLSGIVGDAVLNRLLPQ